MRLDDWVRSKGTGALTRLQEETGLSYTAVHRAVRGKSKPTYETAELISEATGGAVTVPEICRAKKRPKKGKTKARTKRGASGAQPSAAASVA